MIFMPTVQMDECVRCGIRPSRWINRSLIFVLSIMQILSCIFEWLPFQFIGYKSAENTDYG